MTAQPPANTAGLPAVLPAVPLGVMGVGMKKCSIPDWPGRQRQIRQPQKLINLRKQGGQGTSY